jgi:hypothetical protein
MIVVCVLVVSLFFQENFSAGGCFAVAAQYPTGPLRVQDVAMAPCQESIERDYGQADSLFKYTINPCRLQIHDQHMLLKELYFFRLLLRNCHVSL